jgi:hypothetical protein
MATFGIPAFPDFKPMAVEDRAVLHEAIWAFQSDTSELTFTNLFMWRVYYRTAWSRYKDWLLVLCRPDGRPPYFLPPVGPASRLEAVREALTWMRDGENVPHPGIERADGRLVSEIKGFPSLAAERTPDQDDYVYRSGDLIGLAGRKFHNKKNHFNRFLKSYRFEYLPFNPDHAADCASVLEKWCAVRDCEENPVLKAEKAAVLEALTHVGRLGLAGGTIFIDGTIEAFTLGELLNRDTAVIHVEKADPRIPELYAAINQRFCEKQWSGVPFVNREQDLGMPGLRRAKMSYNPVRMVEKYRIALK